MTSWEGLKFFERSHNLKGAGLYVVMVKPKAASLIEVHDSKKIKCRAWLTNEEGDGSKFSL